MLPTRHQNNIIEQELEITARKARRLIVEIVAKSMAPHVGSCLSCVDILVALYFRVLRIDQSNWSSRDIFVLSKAHAAVALYSIFMLKGIIDEETFWGALQSGGKLPAHLDRFTSPGIEASAGALGHGFGMALGMGYGYKLKNDKRRVFTLIGDGESQEGSIWEGAEFASKFKLDNITAILDYNNLQGYGRPTELCYFEPIRDKWQAFGWDVDKVDGHNFSELIKAFKTPHKGKPKIVIARTIKGKGVSFMEDELKWHYFVVTQELKEKALKELEENYEK